MKFESVQAVLDFAISREVEAARLYRQLADEVTRPGMREAFLEFAAQEDGHRARLEKVQAGDTAPLPQSSVEHLHMAEYLVEVQPETGMNYQRALLYAMKAEEAAYRLYSDLASSVTEPGLVSLFRSLAQEEVRHKQRFESEYDDVVLEGV